jgi:hypothetical protein
LAVHIGRHAAEQFGVGQVATVDPAVGMGAPYLVGLFGRRELVVQHSGRFQVGQVRPSVLVHGGVHADVLALGIVHGHAMARVLPRIEGVGCFPADGWQVRHPSSA